MRWRVWVATTARRAITTGQPKDIAKPIAKPLQPALAARVQSGGYSTTALAAAGKEAQTMTPIVTFMLLAAAVVFGAFAFARGTLAGQVSRMSIRGRTAFGLVCIERAANHLGLCSASLDRDIEKWWRYTDSENLDWWGCKAEVEELACLYGPPVPPEKLDLFCQMLSDLDEIGGGNLYGGFRNEYTLKPLLSLTALLRSNGIPLPPTAPFVAASPRRWADAWGRPFDGTKLRTPLEFGSRVSCSIEGYSPIREIRR